MTPGDSICHQPSPESPTYGLTQMLLIINTTLGFLAPTLYEAVEGLRAEFDEGNENFDELTQAFVQLLPPAVPGGLPALVDFAIEFLKILPLVKNVIDWFFSDDNSESFPEIAKILQEILDAVKDGKLGLQTVEMSLYNDASRNARLDFATIRTERVASQDL
jgi:hypothetical protein